MTIHKIKLIRLRESKIEIKCISYTLQSNVIRGYNDVQ